MKQNQEPQKIVISGVRGFVGSNLKVYLYDQQQYHITGASRNVKNLDSTDSHLDQICSYEDLYEGFQPFHAYIHLAGKVIHESYTADEEEYFKINLDQTKKIYDRFLEDEDARIFIFLSTIHVLTEKPDRVIDETFEPQPFTPYGKSKYAAENYIRDHAIPGKRYYILRPSMIHGPGNKGNLNLLYELVRRGIPYPLGSVNNRRSFVSIENLSFVIHEFLNHDVEQGLYHIADDEPTDTHDLIRMIATITGKKHRMISLPLSLIQLIAKAGNVLPLSINEHRLFKLTEDFIVSNEKLKKAIGKELPVRAEDGLRETIKSFRV